MFAKRFARAGSVVRAHFQRLSGLAAQRPGRGEHELTLMFTDIAGFTRLAEALPAPAVAQLLSGHFLALARCIERERGRIDKIMGDGLVALWEHAVGSATPSAPAVRAALAIRAAVEADNAARARRGQTPIRLRVGMHTGTLVEASLGMPGHLGMALCGDTVNVAQRLEDAARDVAVDGAVTIVVSGAVVARAGSGFCFEQLGPLPVRGRDQPVLAFQLG